MRMENKNLFMRDYIPQTIEEIIYEFKYCHCNNQMPKGHKGWMCNNCKRPILREENKCLNF